MSEEQLTVEKMIDAISVEMLTGFMESLDSETTLNEDQLFLRASVNFLLSQLATIERDTAEKCKQIAADREDEMSADYPNPGIDNRISHHFNLGGIA